MEADQGVECLAKQVRLQRQPFVVEVGELVDLPEYEQRPERRGAEQPTATGALVAALWNFFMTASFTWGGTDARKP